MKPTKPGFYWAKVDYWNGKYIDDLDWTVVEVVETHDDLSVVMGFMMPLICGHIEHLMSVQGMSFFSIS